MIRLLVALKNDNNGFIVSAELVLIGTIAVLAMVIGLSEVALNINNELEDLGSAIGNLSQSYQVRGLNGHGGGSESSSYSDNADFCDNYCNIQSADAGAGEGN